VQETKVRKPVVSGTFYPASAEELKKTISAFADKHAQKEEAIACMLPHAGYMYSGKVAAETLSHVKIKEKVLLLGPNHTGFGAPYSIMTEGAWQTPLGQVRIDPVLAEKIREGSKHLEPDSLAHAHEHSLEVELPLLQYFRQDFEIIPVAFLSDDLEALKKTGKDIACAINAAGVKDTTLIIASSDMTHYEAQAEAEKKDKEAIKAILELDEDKLMSCIRRRNISMCGYAPVIAMLACAKGLGAASARLIRYQTSGDVTADYESVVGYAGIIIR